MTNLDRWKLYNRDLFSPDHYIEWGFYSLIAACLERRVFYDNDVNPMFASMYVVFVAPAGVGKGLVIDKCGEFIKHHRSNKPNGKSSVQVTLERMKGKGSTADQYLFGIGADATTYESLLVDLTACTENFQKPDGTHTLQAALYFMLDEYTSIFKEHSETLITFLLTAWNGKDYRRTTKHKGHDDVKNPCINMLAGTTPSEFAKILRKDIIGSGILGRTVLVFGHKNRSRGISIPAPDSEQRRAKEEILSHILKLKNIYQCAQFTPEAQEYLLSWWSDEAAIRISTSQKLDEYYVRKLSHVIKVCMAIHFSEPGYEGLMSLETLKYAISFLNATEVDMHLAMTAGGRNELSPIANNVCAFVSQYSTGVTFNEILCAFITDANEVELQEIVKTLQIQGRIIANVQTGHYFVARKK